MSEPMDLEKAKEIVRKYDEQLRNPRRLTIEMDQFIPHFEQRFAAGFINGTLSERRALIERFRPVVEILETLSTYKKVERDSDHASWGNADDSYFHGAEVADSTTGEFARKALALFQEIEKENGQ